MSGWKTCTALAAGIMFGIFIKHAVLARRAPASLVLRSPKAADLAGARGSDILLQGAYREEEQRLRYVERYRGQNSFGIVTLYGEMPAGFPAHATAAAEKLLAGKPGMAFRGTYSYGGDSEEVLLRFEARPASSFGASVRRMETELRDREVSYFHADGDCGNELDSYNEGLGALVLSTSMGFESKDGVHTEIRSEFPLAGAPRAGRLFAWNTDREDFDVVGSVSWARLTEAEWETLRTRWRKGWVSGSGGRGGAACVMTISAPKDPETLFD